MSDRNGVTRVANTPAPKLRERVDTPVDVWVTDQLGVDYWDATELLFDASLTLDDIEAGLTQLIGPRPGGAA